MLAPDGICKTFDKAANGYGRSEGCTALLLRRLPEALETACRILAVFVGSAVNSVCV